VPVETSVRPRGPYSLALSARRAHDATRSFRGGVLTALLGDGERAAARQRQDGTLALRADSEAGLDRLRFVLGAEDDHAEFLERFADDPLLGRSVRHLRGLRPLRTSTVVHALLRALCGQLVDWKRARNVERRLVHAACPGSDGLFEPPRAEHFAGFAPVELQRFGLSARKATTLVRLCRSLDLERLRSQPTDAVAVRLERERGLGPWSVGVICLEGLGRYERGLVGDLGLIKLCAALEGRWVEAEETAELLAPYGEWAGLASVYLLAGAARGLVPGVVSSEKVRLARSKARLAA
jgi:3-methyladenine DNA glycosylase/8-oxoguanine DNA glycosylase